MTAEEYQQLREFKEFKKQLRTAVANYMRSEGCSCCQNIDGHKEDADALGKLLGVKKYSDGSGYDFSPHQDKY